MILQALYDYYKRKESNPDSGIAPEGLSYEKIPFLVHLDKNGQFLSIEDTRAQEGKQLVGKKFLVPAAVSRTVGIKANLLWDKADYALGIPDASKIAEIDKKAKKDPKKYTAEFIAQEKADIEDNTKKRLAAFMSNIEEQSFSTEQSVKAVLSFLSENPQEKIEKKIGKDGELIQSIVATNPNISFWIEGDESPVCSLFNKSLSIVTNESNDKVSATCLVTGEKASIARIHPMLKNVIGAQSSGAAIVSFNKPSFTSFRKEQNYNAPVSERATFAYTTALNSMLAKDSPNKMRIGDTTAVFWSEKKTKFEAFFSSLWNCAPKDNPDADVQAIKQLYNSVYTGANIPEVDAKFYVLGLSPNAARLSVRLWQTGTVEDFSKKIRAHFDDLKIVSSKKDTGHGALFYLLATLVRDIKDLPPNLSGDMVKSILQGIPYPARLQQMCLQRIRKDFEPSISDMRMRAALLKAFLNRRNRFYKTSEKEISVSLDLTNENIGYRLGRLFAAFEKLQEDAQPGINATIRDRYYGAASSTPCTVFPQLFKLKNHHLAKLSNIGQKVNYEKLFGEITSAIPADGIPAHLNLDDQSRFAIGYYHQRQDFFKTSKSEK